MAKLINLEDGALIFAKIIGGGTIEGDTVFSDDVAIEGILLVGDGAAQVDSEVVSIEGGAHISERIVTGQNTSPSSTDALDVSSSNSVSLTAFSGDVTINGLSGGIAGQTVVLFKTSLSNNVIINHNNGLGTQPIFSKDGLSITLPSYGGLTLVCNGSTWFEAAH